MGSEDDVLDDVFVPPDLPLEAIAEEVQNSWHLKVLLTHAAHSKPTPACPSTVGKNPFSRAFHSKSAC